MLVLAPTPKMGTVDSWFCVLEAALRAHPEWVVNVVLMAPTKLVSLSTNHPIYGQLASIGTKFYVMNHLGTKIYSFKNLGDAKTFCVRRKFASRVLQAAPKRAQKVITFATDKILCLKKQASATELEALKAALVCYDVEGAQKEDAPVWLATYLRGERFSLLHGLAVPIRQEPSQEKIDGSRLRVDVPIREHAFAYSTAHAQDYLCRYGSRLSPTVTGVPRHDPTVVQHYSQEPTIGGGGRVALVLSRPATSRADKPNGPTDWLPLGRKVQLFRALHRVLSLERGIKLSVSCHPSERPEQLQRLLRSILGRSTEGTAWEIVFLTPLAMARTVSFGVAFSSSTVVDLLAQGVPSIELQCVDDVPDYSGPDAVRDSTGRILRTDVRRAGLVLPADDERDLAEQVDRIITEREAVVEELRNNYLLTYAEPKGAVASILQHLESAARSV